MRPFTGNAGAFIALKAGMTAASIWMTEKRRKTHPKKALVSVIVSNAAMAAIVVHNYRVTQK